MRTGSTVSALSHDPQIRQNDSQWPGTTEPPQLTFDGDVFELTAEDWALFVREAERRLRIVESLFKNSIAQPVSNNALQQAAIELHTVKGDAGIVGAMDFRAAVHEAESMLFALSRREEESRSPESVLMVVDVLWRALEPHRKQANAEAAPPQPPPRADDSAPLVRKLHDSVRPSRRPDADRSGMVSALGGAPTESATLPISLLRRIELGAVRVLELTGNPRGPLASALQELETAVVAAASTEASELWSRLEHATPAFASAAGKRASVSCGGYDTPIPRRHYRALMSALVQLLRNAIAHGLEDEEVREERHKHPIGRIAFDARTRFDAVIVSIEDDGGGIDEEALLASAVTEGHLTVEQAARLPREEVYELMFLPTLSTAEQPTALAGRGLGLDVVRRELEQIGATLDVKSEPERFTRFEIVLPLGV